MVTRFFIIFFILFFTKFSRAQSSFQEKQFTEAIQTSLGCPTFKDLFWTQIYRNINLKYSKDSFSLPYPELNKLSHELLKTIYEELPKQLKIKSQSQHLEALTALELGDETSKEKQILKRKMAFLLNKIEKLSVGLGLACLNPENDLLLERSHSDETTLALSSVQGAQKAFSTLYQNCTVLNLPPIKKSDPDVQGISVVGMHPDGVGFKRIVSSPNELNITNPYLKLSPAPEHSCQNLKNNPPIYDYGGKPHATSDLDSPLDFFKNAGTGTSAFGTDCSGLVFTALASAGLKLTKSVALKAISVNGVSAQMLSNPAPNGLDCLERVTFTQSLGLAPGDIIARPGHVVMVDEVFDDPFGISRLQRLTDCTPSQISVSKFKFTIFQSSPVKGGIGTHRMPIADYLELSPQWQPGVLHYALKACKAKFGQNSASAASDGLAIVRHKDDSACRASPIKLVSEECVRSCSSQ